MYLCLSALAESSSGTSMMCFVLLLDVVRVGECSYEDRGPLPGPRCLSTEGCARPFLSATNDLTAFLT